MEKRVEFRFVLDFIILAKWCSLKLYTESCEERRSQERCSFLHHFFFFLASSTAYLLDSDILYRENLASSRMCVQFALLVLSHSAKQHSILPSGVLCAPWIIFKITPVWVTIPADLRIKSALSIFSPEWLSWVKNGIRCIIHGEFDQLCEMLLV